MLFTETMGGGYYANFLHYIIFPIFPYYATIGNLLNITFIFDTCQIWLWLENFIRCFHKIANFPNREIKE